MQRPLILLTIIVALAIGVAAHPASAQETPDLSGDWLVWLVEDSSPCLIWIDHDEDELAGAMVCLGFGQGRLKGALASDGSYELTMNFEHGGGLTFTSPVADFGTEVTWSFQRGDDVIARYSAEVGAVQMVEPRWGDMNCDGTIDGTDAIYVLSERVDDCPETINGRPLVGRFNPFALGGDVNLDHQRDSRDALLILQFEAGLLERLPVL